MSADTDEPFWFALLLIIPAVVYLSARSRASAICCLASALRSLSLSAPAHSLNRSSRNLMNSRIDYLYKIGVFSGWRCGCFMPEATHVIQHNAAF